MRTWVAVAVVCVLAACGGDTTDVASTDASSTTTSAAPVERVITIDFDDLPPDYAVTADASGPTLYSLGGEDPGEATVEAAVRRTSMPEYGLTVSVWADQADAIIESWRVSETATPSSMRGGAAFTVEHEGRIIQVMWAEGDDAVIVVGPSVPEDELVAIVDGIRITST